MNLKEKIKVTAKEKSWKLCDHQVNTNQECDVSDKTTQQTNQKKPTKQTKTSAILGLLALD